MQIYKTSSDVAVLLKNIIITSKKIKLRLPTGPKTKRNFKQNYYVIQNELVFCSVEVNNFPKLISLCNTEVTLKREKDACC